MALSIIINGIEISNYLDKYQCQINEIYDNENSFEAIDGTAQKIYLGSKRTLSVDFEPMSTEQINELFEAIRSDRDVEITYVDPQDGENTTRTFTCDNLPSATYFECDPNPQTNETILFWTLPTITFEQKNIELVGGTAGYEYYDYQIYIGGFLFSSDRIADDLSITNSVSCNGFSVGQIASYGISGKVLLLGTSDIPTNNSEIILQKRTITIYEDDSDTEYGDWQTIAICFLKEMQVHDKIMSFSGTDCTCFLDNNYYINYNLNSATAQNVSVHISAIANLLKDLSGHSEITIPYYCDNVPIQPQEEQNARTLLTRVAESAGVNYRQKITTNDNSDEITLDTFAFGENVYNLNNSQISDIQHGRLGNNIELIILYCGSITKLPTYIYPTMYQDYNIYVVGNIQSGTYPNAATTLEVQAPYYAISAPTGGNFNALLNMNFGTEFSVSKAKVDEFIPIGSLINFTEQTALNSYTFYATSISYKLTKHGIYASISGSARNFSDYKYIGGMQRQLENKFTLNSTYNNIYIDTDGIKLAAPKDV